jgi:hypothetical protein
LWAVGQQPNLFTRCSARLALIIVALAIADASFPSGAQQCPPGSCGPHDFGSATTIGRQKHNLRSPDVLLRAVAVGHHRLKLPTVSDTQLNVGSLVHSSDSHTRVCQRIPKRIEMSDLVH